MANIGATTAFYSRDIFDAREQRSEQEHERLATGKGMPMRGFFVAMADTFIRLCWDKGGDYGCICDGLPRDWHACVGLAQALSEITRAGCFGANDTNTEGIWKN